MAWAPNCLVGTATLVRRGESMAGMLALWMLARSTQLWVQAEKMVTSKHEQKHH